MDFILATLYVLIPLALARSSLGLKPQYQEKILIVDESFSKQFGKLAKLKTIDGVDYLANLLGVTAGILLAATIISKYVFSYELSHNVMFAKAFVYSFIGFFSIKWYTKPHKFSLSFLKDMAQISALALAMPLIDIFLGIEYTSLPYQYIYMHSSLMGLPLPESPHVIIMGVIMSLYMLIAMTIMWAVTSLLMALYFVPVFSVSYGVLKFCNALEKMWGKNALNAVLVLLVVVTQYYSWYKS
ncbi:hypothetical protein [Amphritea sp.]|uniref:hypothetical protein n=1 Tax=Amphritea sp. TaxID=1872502 RepID=UPI0025B919B3|nr:hypothetical protein [Amphritea sp.]